jgi:hypothetical protein
MLRATGGTLMLRPVAIVCLLAASAASVSAHHGTGTFELSKSVTFNGTITRVDLVNPHSWLYFDVKEPDGKTSKHRCEMRSAHTLRRSGWSKEVLPVGAKVTIEAAPDRVDPASCYLNTIRFENGSHMDRYGQYVKGTGGNLREVRGELLTATKAKAATRAPRLPSGEPNLAGDWAPEQVVMADPRGSGGGLVRLSTVAEIDARRGGAPAAGGARPGGPPPAAGAPPPPGARPGGPGRGGPRQYGGTELTPLAEQQAAAFQQADNPRFRCETTNIIFDWTFDGPINRITQSRDAITIEYGQLNLKRTVYMNMKAHPTAIKPTRAGHSIGRWEGDTLVVDTVGFLPGVLNAPTRHSDKLHVVERFTLDPKTMKIARSWTAEDPIYLKGQAKGEDVVQVADAPYTKDDCKEQGFINYSQQTKK